MLPEAIAIVCPPNVGYFRITDLDDISIISSCKKKFLSYHENVKLFYDAHSSNNGHIYNIKSTAKIIDFRISDANVN